MADKRQKGIIIIKPIVYGTVAQWLGKKADESKTHKWCCYLRPFRPEDDLSFIKRVVFTLHPSFENPVICVDSQPFEITNCGWGEFEIIIRVEFVDPKEKPVEVVHLLKLFPDTNTQLSTKKPVVSEHYDELIFYEPRSSLHKILTQQKIVIPRKLSCQDAIEQYGKPLSEQKEFLKLQKAMERVDQQIKSLEERYKRAERETSLLKEEIFKLDQKMK